MVNKLIGPPTPFAWLESVKEQVVATQFWINRHDLSTHEIYTRLYNLGTQCGLSRLYIHSELIDIERGVGTTGGWDIYPYDIWELIGHMKLYPEQALKLHIGTDDLRYWEIGDPNRMRYGVCRI